MTATVRVGMIMTVKVEVRARVEVEVVVRARVAVAVTVAVRAIAIMKATATRATTLNTTIHPVATTVQPIHLFVTNTKDAEEEIATIENVGNEHPHSNAQNERVGHLCPVTNRVKLVGEGHVTVDKLVNDVDQDAVHAHRLDRIAGPHFPHIHQKVHQGKHDKTRSSGDTDEGRVPLVLVDRHVAVILFESAEKPAEEQQQKTRHCIRPNAIHRLLHLLNDQSHEGAKIDEEDGVQESHDSLALEVVAVIHIRHRRPLVDVVFSQQLHVNVPIDAASASLVASEVTDASRTRIPSRTPRCGDEHGDKPMPANEKQGLVKREGAKEGKNRVEATD